MKLFTQETTITSRKDSNCVKKTGNYLAKKQITMSSVWSVLLILMLKVVTVVRLECISGAVLRAQCITLSNRGELNHRITTRR